MKERAVEVNFDGELIAVRQDLTSMQRQSLLELLSKYRHCFTFPGDPIGYCDLFPDVIITGDAFPTYRMPYRVSDGNRASIKEHVDEMLSQGIIRHSFSPWASAPHIVPKKDGTSRLVIDYRPVNRLTKKDSYPLPNIELCLNC